MAPRTFMSLKPGMPKPVLLAAKAAAPPVPGALAGNQPAPAAPAKKVDATQAETPQKSIVIKPKTIGGKPTDPLSAHAPKAMASSAPPSKPASSLIAKKKEVQAPSNLETVTNLTDGAPHTTSPDDDCGDAETAGADVHQDVVVAAKEDGAPCVSTKKAPGKGFGGSFSAVPNKVEVTKSATKPLAIKAKTSKPATEETGAERLAAMLGSSSGEKKVRPIHGCGCLLGIQVSSFSFASFPAFPFHFHPFDLSDVQPSRPHTPNQKVVVPAAPMSSLPKGTKLKIGAPIKLKASVSLPCAHRQTPLQAHPHPHMPACRPPHPPPFDQRTA